LKKIYSRFGIDKSAVPIHRVDAPSIAAKAMENVNARTNPARAEVGDLEDILRRSFAVTD
jgi:alcohol dehydrogenase class IV